MQGDEEAPAVRRRKLRARIEGHAERCRVRRKLDRGPREAAAVAGPFEFGVGRQRAAPSVAVGPAVAGAGAHEAHKIRRGPAVAPVPFVHRRPQSAGRRVEREPHGVSQSGRDDALARSVRRVAHDRGAATVRLAAHVARGADRDVEPPVRTKGDRSGPVMRAGRQIGNDHDRLDRAARGGIVAEPQHPPGFGHPQISVANGEAVRQAQSLDDGHGRANRLRPASRGDGDDASVPRNRHQQRSGRIEREHARRPEAVRNDVDTEAGVESQRWLFGSRGGGGAERDDQRDDERGAESSAECLTTPAPSSSIPPHGAAHRSHTRPLVIRPDLWIALLRVVVGIWFVKAVWTKFSLAYLWDAIPYPTVSPRFLAFQPKRVAEFAAGNPIEWYKDFLEGTVLPNSRVFATLQTWGEAAVGLGLILGLLTGLTALVGLFLSLNYGLASQWMSFGQQGFHLMLVTSMIIFLLARAGRTLGLDGWILAHSGRRWLRLLM